MKVDTMDAKPPRWLTVGLALPLVFWPFFCLASLMAFDASGSEDNVFLQMFALAVLLYGPAIAVSWALRRAFVAKGMRHSALAATLLPLLNLITAATAIGLLVAVCDGNTVCR